MATSLLLISAIRQLHAREFAWNVSHLDRLAGTDRLRQAVERGHLPQLLREWDAEAEEFRRAREPYLLYR